MKLVKKFWSFDFLIDLILTTLILWVCYPYSTLLDRIMVIAAVYITLFYYQSKIK